MSLDVDFPSFGFSTETDALPKTEDCDGGTMVRFGESGVLEWDDWYDRCNK